MKTKLLSWVLILCLAVGMGVFMVGCNQPTPDDNQNQNVQDNEGQNPPDNGQQNPPENNDDDPPPPPTVEELLQEEDKQYERVIYLAPNESYNLKEQLAYEGAVVRSATYSTESENFTVSDRGVIVAGEGGEEVTSDVLTVTLGNKEQSVLVHVVNREKYGDKFMTVDVGRLYGKSVIFFGDSITHNWARFPSGDRESDNKSTSLGYNHIPLMNEVCKFSKIVNAAWSGGTVGYLPSSKERFTYKSFPGSVDNHLEDLKSADYAFVFYGTNDLTEQVPIGNEDDTMVADEKTDYGFYAGLNYALSGMRNANPNTKIIMLNILRRANVNYGKYKISAYNKAIKTAAEKYNTKFLDIFQLITSDQYSTLLNKDGLHPNDAGYRVIADYLMSGQ